MVLGRRIRWGLESSVGSFLHVSCWLWLRSQLMLLAGTLIYASLCGLGFLIHSGWVPSVIILRQRENGESERANKWVSELGRSYIIIYGLAMDITQHCFYWFPVVEEIKSHSMFKGKVNRVHLSQVSKETWGTEKIARFTLRKYIWPQDPLTHGPL